MPRSSLARILRRSALAAAAGALVLGGCGDDGATELVEGVVVDVDAIDNTFRPETVEVAPGTTVRWTNLGRNDHNVIPAEEGDEFLQVEVEEFEPGDEHEVRFTEPGTYRYYCTLHGTANAGMIGAVEVTG